MLEETIEFIRLLFFSYCTLYLFTVYCKGESSINIVFIKMLQALSAKAIQPQLTTERQRKSSQKKTEILMIPEIFSCVYCA